MMKVCKSGFHLFFHSKWVKEWEQLFMWPWVNVKNSSRLSYTDYSQNCNSIVIEWPKVVKRG